MRMHNLFGEDLFDEFFRDFPFYDDRAEKRIAHKLYGHKGQHLMKTDVKERKDTYVLEMDLPGFRKDEIAVSLNNGYLTIHAEKKLEQDQKEEKEQYLRRERYAGSCERTFYVGDALTETDIKGEFQHGILKLTIPKKEETSAVEEKKYISIE